MTTPIVKYWNGSSWEEVGANANKIKITNKLAESP